MPNIVTLLSRNDSHQTVILRNFRSSDSRENSAVFPESSSRRPPRTKREPRPHPDAAVGAALGSVAGIIVLALPGFPGTSALALVGPLTPIVFGAGIGLVVGSIFAWIRS
jgi:hypothetical protein